MVVEISNFFTHHLWDFPCFSLAKKFTHNDFCIPAGHGLSCSPHFRRHATESITPTPRQTSFLHLTPHGCQIHANSRPNTTISAPPPSLVTRLSTISTLTKVALLPLNASQSALNPASPISFPPNRQYSYSVPELAKALAPGSETEQSRSHN
jgi:hypothetical protein